MSRDRASRPTLLAAAVAAALLAGGCAGQAASTQAQSIAGLWDLFVALGVVVALIVWGLTTIAIVRSWRRRAATEAPAQTHGSRNLEMLWTGIPVLTVLVLFVLTLGTLTTVDAQAPRPSLTVAVTVSRWAWSFDYQPSGVVVQGDTNEPPVLVLPTGETVHLTLDATDVIHAFYVPAFLFKRDAIPGRTTSFDLKVTDLGDYAGQCAEFCGIYHDRMTFTVRAVSSVDFQAWIVGAGAASATPSNPASPAP